MARLFSSTEIGRLIGADASSVNRWIDAGRLRAHRTPGGHRRVQQGDLLSFLSENQLPVPDELQLEPEEPTLVICDADAQHLRALSRGLRAERPALQIVACASALEGLLKIGVYRPPLALCDVLMPGLDWPAALRSIGTAPETQGTRLLACAARRSAQLEAQVLDAGALALLPKPVRAAELLDRLP
jgi:excisionase family DNA binding protein